MKNRDLFQIAQGLRLPVVMDIKGVKVAYAISKNLNMLQSKIDSLNKIRVNDDPEFKKYNDERIALAAKLCEKQGDRPKIVDGQFTFSQDSRKLFDVEVEKLQVKYKDALDRNAAREPKFQEAMESDVEIGFYKILLSDLPSDATATQITALWPMLVEEKGLESEKLTVVKN